MNAHSPIRCSSPRASVHLAEFLTRARSAAFVCGLAAVCSSAATLAQPYIPQLLGSYGGAGQVFAVSATPDYAYLACGTRGVRVVDYRSTDSLGNLREVGRWDGGIELRDVQVRGNYAYAADEQYGLRILQLNGATTTLVGEYPTGPSRSKSGLPHAIHVAGRYAYVALSGSGTYGKQVKIFDVNNPASPREAGEILTAAWGGGGVLDVCVVPPYAYLVDENRWLTAHDISTPASPRLVDARRQDLVSEHVYATATHVFVTTGSAEGGTKEGVNVYQAPRSASPQLQFCSLVNVGPAQGVKALGDRLYVANNNWGFEVRNITNPCSSTKVSAGDPLGMGNATAVDVRGARLFLGCANGLYVLQVAPGTPRLTLGSQGGRPEVTVRGDLDASVELQVSESAAGPWSPVARLTLETGESRWVDAGAVGDVVRIYRAEAR
jgi:hypothetical protein